MTQTETKPDPTASFGNRGAVEYVPGLKMSSKIDELTQAKVKFHLECPAVIGLDADGKIGKVGSQRNYKYASLAAINELVTPLLAKHGLDFEQIVLGDTMVNILSHVSGQMQMALVDITRFIKPFPGQSEVDAKAMGASIAYGRRYTKLAFLDLIGAQEDDENRVPNAGDRKPFDASKAGQQQQPPTTTERRRDPESGARVSEPAACTKFFGDHESGQMTTWWHSCTVVKTGKSEKKAQDGSTYTANWTIYEAIAQSGEKYKFFSDDDAALINDCIHSHVGTTFSFRLNKRGRYSDYMITEKTLNPLTPEDVSVPIGSITITITEFASRKSGDAVVAGLVTTRGRFGALGEELCTQLADIHEKSHEVRVLFAATRQGRLITEIANEDPHAEPNDDQTDRTPGSDEADDAQADGADGAPEGPDGPGVVRGAVDPDDVPF